MDDQGIFDNTIDLMPIEQIDINEFKSDIHKIFMRWKEMYRKLKIHIENTNCTDREEATLIRTWCIRQRMLYKKGTMSKERIDLLNLLPSWKWTVYEDQWTDTYNKLTAYISIHKKIPPRSQGSLSIWCGRQRNLYKNGQLSQSRIDLLEQIEKWKWGIRGSQFDDVWIKKFRDFSDYLKNSNMNDITQFKDCSQLKGWFRNQKCQHRTLSYKRFELFRSLLGNKWWQVDNANILCW